MKRPTANDSPQAIELRTAAMEFSKPHPEDPTFGEDTAGMNRNSRLLRAARKYAVVAYAEEAHEADPGYVNGLVRRIEELNEWITKIQKSNAALWHERNAALSGGWAAMKKLYATNERKDNDRLRSRIAMLEGRLAGIGQPVAKGF